MIDNVWVVVRCEDGHDMWGGFLCSVTWKILRRACKTCGRRPDESNIAWPSPTPKKHRVASQPAPVECLAIAQAAARYLEHQQTEARAKNEWLSPPANPVTNYLTRRGQWEEARAERKAARRALKAALKGMP